jgi:hypothetical protein
MVKLKCLIVLGLFCANAVLAQGTMLFTWHGDSNFFQASFQITMDETLPGSVFNSSLWTNSIQITSLDGLTYRASNQSPAPHISGRFEPLGFTYILADQSTESSLYVTVVSGQGAAINEISNLPNGRHGEYGFWSYEVVPEPSMVSILLCGSVVWLIKRKRADS